MIQTNFQLKSHGCDNVYTTGLLNEYDQILLGNCKKYSTMYFSFSDSVNETMALTVIKYAIERYLKWTPFQAYHMLDKNIVVQLKLNPLLAHIKFPPELKKDKDLWYVVHRIYPHLFPLSKKNLITTLMSRLTSGKKIKFPSDYFFCEEGEFRACICLQYILEHFLVFKDIESIYEFFSNTEVAARSLKKYNLLKVCGLYFDSPLCFLHAALPTKQKNEFYYQYYSFMNDFQKKEDVELTAYDQLYLG